MAGKRRVLVVDEDPGRARSLGAMVTDLGYELAAIVASAGDAEASWKVSAPDLVLLTDGSSAAGRADDDHLVRKSSVPVIRLTDESDTAAPPDPAGDPDCRLSRPFSARELRATIELVLCRHDASRGVHDLDERFFAVSVDMLCFLGFNGYFARLNPAWERALGFTRAELMARPFIEFVHPDDRERTLRQNREVKGGGQALAFENRYLCKDGSYRWFRWNAAADPGEQLIYSAARDITESKRNEEERERLVRELRTALAEVRTLREILPMCSYCKKIRDDEDYWHSVDTYIAHHTATRFSHGICPECMDAIVEPQIAVRGE